MSSSPAPSPPLAARFFRLAALALPLVLVAGLLACNAIHLQHQRLRRDFAQIGMHEHTVTFGPDRVHYWRSSARAGDRTTVLLLHGFGGSAVWQWAEQLPALMGDRRVLVPDLLWFGGSTSSDDDARLEHQVAAMVALLDREGVSKVDVVGISYGGLVGWQLARAQGDRVRRLVLVDSPGPEFTPEDQAAMLQRFGVADVPELIIPDDEAAVQRLLEVAYHDPPNPPRFALRQVKSYMYDPYRDGQLALLEALVEHQARYLADQWVSAKVGLIWGDDDQVFPLEIAQRLSDRLEAPLHVLPQARHAPNIEYPEAFNEALLELLDGSELR